jgi:hypothetical protein
VLVTWKAPAFLGSGKVLAYQVRWSSNGGRTWTTWASTKLVLKAARSGLVKGKSYRIQVRAINGSEAGVVATLIFTQGK